MISLCKLQEKRKKIPLSSNNLATWSLIGQHLLKNQGIVKTSSTYFASSVNAIIPDAIAVAAELPPNWYSHCPFSPAVT